jgi:glycosyltransferase involved in cell wall biosynthesis
MGDSKVARTKIIIITDAWKPQVSGVVTTYENIIQNLPEDYSVDVIHPGLFKWIDIPFYKSIPWAKCSYSRMEHMLYTRRLDWNMQGYFVKFHIATEGPLGFRARRALTAMNYSYTSAYHTKFPEFIKELIGIPTWMTRWYFDWFHKNSKVVMCSSKSNAEENKQWNTVVLGKGYDNHFTFKDKTLFDPVLLYVGRVSKEKNINDFCRLEIGGAKKIVVGDGPYRKQLEKLYPNVRFVGYKFGKELAQYYQSADVCVFPSKVDTFGITILESMACGTPVAGYPVTGPIDQIVNGVNGYVSEDLERAVMKCLTIDREQTAESVKHITWKESAKQFATYVSS